MYCTAADKQCSPVKASSSGAGAALTEMPNTKRRQAASERRVSKLFVDRILGNVCGSDGEKRRWWCF